MSTLRSYFDPANQTATGPTSFMTERNQREVRCGICARLIYVDEETYRFGNDEKNSVLENAFRCEICEAEDDEFLYLH